MDRPNTPEPDSEEYRKHYPSPTTKAKIQGAVEFCEAMNIPYSKADVFRFFKVTNTAGWKALAEGAKTSRQKSKHF